MVDNAAANAKKRRRVSKSRISVPTAVGTDEAVEADEDDYDSDMNEEIGVAVDEDEIVARTLPSTSDDESET